MRLLGAIYCARILWNDPSVSPVDRRMLQLAIRVPLLILTCLPIKSARSWGGHHDRKVQALLRRTEDEIENDAEVKEKRLMCAKERATSVEEYADAAVALDALQGHDDWKSSRNSIEPSYRPDVIEAHIRYLESAIKSGNKAYLYMVLHLALSRDLGGMSNIRLYKHSWYGTKDLVDRFSETMLAAIETLIELMAETNTSDHMAMEYRELLQDAAKHHGRTALCFSGGALLGMKHVGVAKCLWHANMLPDIISGTSAGSIVAAIIATRTDEEMEESLQQFPHSNLGVFDRSDAPRGVVSWCKRRLDTQYRTGRWMDPSYLQNVMKEWLGDLTFREAYNKTSRTLNITVSKAESAEPTLLNHVTAPNVLIWSAVCASCAVPLVFPAATIFQKDPDNGTQSWMEHSQQPLLGAFSYVDGSLDHDVPMEQLKRLFDVSFLIVAQTNAHVRLCIKYEEEFHGQQPKSPSPRSGLLDLTKAYIHGIAVHTAQTLAALGLPPGFWRWSAVLTQQYTGHINIYPDWRLGEILTMCSNPTAEFITRATMDGERATWPKIVRIKNALTIELALQRAMQELSKLHHFPDHAEHILSRGRTGYRRAAEQPKFLRSRSLGEARDRQQRREAGETEQANGTGPALAHRRNKSLGSLNMKSSSGTHTPPVLASRYSTNSSDLQMTARS